MRSDWSGSKNGRATANRRILSAYVWEWIRAVDKGAVDSASGLRIGLSPSVSIYTLDFGAGDRDRTGDIQLGKLTFYH
jgi:hypothetical protein